MRLAPILGHEALESAGQLPDRPWPVLPRPAHFRSSRTPCGPAPAQGPFSCRKGVTITVALHKRPPVRARAAAHGPGCTRAQTTSGPGPGRSARSGVHTRSGAQGCTQGCTRGPRGPLHTRSGALGRTRGAGTMPEVTPARDARTRSRCAAPPLARCRDLAAIRTCLRSWNECALPTERRARWRRATRAHGNSRSVLTLGRRAALELRRHRDHRTVDARAG